MPTYFDYAGAKKQGYSDDEIAGFLEQQRSQGLDIGIRESELGAQLKKGGALQTIKNVKDFQGDVGKGALKGIASSVSGASQLGQKLLNFGTKKLGLGQQNITKLSPELTTPKTTGEKLGFAGEQIAEYFVPASRFAKAGQVVEKGLAGATKVPRFLTNTARLATRSGLGAAEVGGVTAVQTGGDKEQIEKSMLLGGGIPIVGMGIRGLAGPLSRKIENVLVKPTQTDLKGGFKANTIFKYNLGGTLKQTAEKTHSLISSLSNELKSNLAAQKTKIPVGQLLSETRKELVGNKVSTFGSNLAIRNAFNKFQKELKLISKNGVVDIADAQQLKRSVGKLGAWLRGARDPESNATEKVANTLYTKLRIAIENKSPKEVASINAKLSELIPVENAVTRRLTVAERNSLLSLGDIVAAVPGAVNPANWWIFVLNRVLQSGRTAKALSKIAPQKELTGLRGAVFGSGNQEQPLFVKTLVRQTKPKEVLGSGEVKAPPAIPMRFRDTRKYGKPKTYTTR